MPKELNTSNLDNETSENSIKGVPELSGESENKSSSIPYENSGWADPEEIKTDEAVDDIVRREGDELLAVEDAKHVTPPKKHWYGVFKKKKIVIPAVILLIVVLLAVIPRTRYPIFGLFWKQDYKLLVIDSETNRPVSDASVTLAGKTAITNNQGQAYLKIAVGHQTIIISKSYYKSLNKTILVPLRVHSTVYYALQATGRPVPITVVNKITNTPLDNALIKTANTESRTDKNGQTTIVLPANKTTLNGTITDNGYNANPVTIQITTKPVPANSFSLTPTGQVYFLSNTSGSIDVVKANLDGTAQQTVLAGTGNEDPNNTVLLATRDWHYLALLAQRSGITASLYLITTTSDKLSVIDSGNATFTPIGWYNDYFLYDVKRNDIPVSQKGHELLKSYNANTGQITTLDQSQIQTTGGHSFYTGFSNFYIIDGELSYVVQWYPNSGSSVQDLTNQQDALRSVQPGGQSNQNHKSFKASQTSYLQTVLYNPQNIYLGDFPYNGNPTYYTFNSNTVKTTAITGATFSRAYPTFLLSPSGNQTFWDKPLDGKNTLFIGNQSTASSNQIASLSDYQPYGWYTDSYLLLSKGGSELYTSSPTSLTNNAQPVKITDYYKSAQTYSGSGYGYGGL